MPLKIPPFTPVPIQPTSAEPFSTFVKNTPPAITPLSGSELIALVQNGGPVHSTVGVVVPPFPAHRTILTANTNYYISTTGSDANSGTSLGAAWATFQHACDFIAENLDIAGFQITINIGAGTFAGAGAKSTVGAGIIYVLGAGTGSTTITTGPNDGVFNFGESLCFNVLNGSAWFMKELTVLGVGSNGEQIGIFVPAILLNIGQPGGAVGGSFASASSVANPNPGFMFSLFQITVIHTVSSFTFDRTHTTGNLLTEYEIGEGGVIQFNGVTITISGSPTYSSGFFLLYSDSMLAGGSLTINGAFTGPAGLISFGSSINFDITVSNGNTFVLDNSGSLPDSSAAFASPGYQSLSGAPATTNLPVPTHGVFKDSNQSTATKAMVLYANDAGTVFPLTPVRTIFADLPASPHQGDMASISDGKAANCGDGSCTTFGTSVTAGGGALNLLIWYNGTNWTLMGK